MELAGRQVEIAHPFLKDFNFYKSVKVYMININIKITCLYYHMFRFLIT